MRPRNFGIIGNIAVLLPPQSDWYILNRSLFVPAIALHLASRLVSIEYQRGLALLLVVLQTGAWDPASLRDCLGVLARVLQHRQTSRCTSRPSNEVGEINLGLVEVSR